MPSQQICPDEIMQNWEYQLPSGVILRGQRSRVQGKPVIHFLHGNGFCGLSYWPLLNRLLPRFDLFIHDIQGHGDSEAGDRFWGWNENAEMVHQVWLKFQQDYQQVPVYAAGHSLGGVLTSLLAARQPHLFKGLVLLDPVIFTPKMLLGMQLFKFLRLKNPNPLAAKALRRRNGWTSRTEARQDFEGRGVFKNWDAAALSAHVEHALYEQGNELTRLKCAPEREAEIFASFPTKLWEALRNLRQPVSVFYGKETYPFVKQSVSMLKQKNRFVSSQELPGGHCFMQEYPEMAAKAMTDAIAGFKSRMRE